MADRQENIDAFYWAVGPCCAGCDWWGSINSSVGECTKSAPVAAGDRIAMLGMERASIDPGAGHILTTRNHRCGDFRDTFDWSSLPLPYRKRIGALTKEPHHAAR
ncbi:hypothetical protein ABNQ39_00315 (plasmid) [Azospirillum sp. A26]|uniref:hypothetical protein n=1 Tax=Azospirillum sp. A26 TaxID=3160607 RepID=UPI0036711A28